MMVWSNYSSFETLHSVGIAWSYTVNTANLTFQAGSAYAALESKKYLLLQPASFVSSQSVRFTFKEARSTMPQGHARCKI